MSKKFAIYFDDCIDQETIDLLRSYFVNNIARWIGEKDDENSLG